MTRSCTASARCSTRCPGTVGPSSPTCAPCTPGCGPTQAEAALHGGELAQEREWSNERSLDWWVLDEWADHARLHNMVSELNKLYRAQPALWERDFSPLGFRWIDASDSDHNVFSFYRSRRHLSNGQADQGERPGGGPVAPGATSSSAWPTCRPYPRSGTGSGCLGPGAGLSC